MKNKRAISRLPISNPFPVNVDLTFKISTHEKTIYIPGKVAIKKNFNSNNNKSIHRKIPK